MDETRFNLHGVRYQVSDVARAAAFYAANLGFTVQHQQLPAFASVSLGGFTLLLSGPGASGSRPMPGGQPQQPGGWNRIVLRVADLPAHIDALKNAGVTFSQSDGERSRRPADPGGGSGWEPHRALRARVRRPTILTSGVSTVVTGRHFERPAVERFVRAWQEAFDRGDYEAMADAYSDDAVLGATGVPTVSGREAIVRFWRTACETAKQAGIRRTVHSDQYDSCGDLAYLQGTLALNAGRRTTVVWYVTVWKRFGESDWKIVADTSTVVASVVASVGQ